MKSFICFKNLETPCLLTLVFATIIGRSYSFLLVRSYDLKLLLAKQTTPPCVNYQNIGDHVNHIVCASFCDTSLGMAYKNVDSSEPPSWIEGESHVETVLFVECGFGNDSHGQSATKAAVRACRNAIEFNSIPSVARLVPGGYEGLKLDVILAIPPQYKHSLELSQVQKVFPYGSVRFQIQDGGMIAPSGISIETLGDKNEDMVIVCAAVTVGY